MYSILNIIFLLLSVSGGADTEKPGPESAKLPESAEVSKPLTCTYSTYQWSVKEKRPVNRRTIRKSYLKVTDKERSPDDPRCTVCLEDQREIDLAALGFSGAGKISVCYVYKDSLQQALKIIAGSESFELVDAAGYRVGKTRGKIVDGKRTQFSNHSFGTAIDINAAFNGLYSRCNIKEVTVNNLKKCRLGIGGNWNPVKNPGRTITRQGIVYKTITSFTGWRWGGGITGKIKDLMHFSITGY